MPLTISQPCKTIYQILTELFLDIDADRSGDLTRREFMSALDFNDYLRSRLVDMDMTPEYLKEVSV